MPTPQREKVLPRLRWHTWTPKGVGQLGKVGWRREATWPGLHSKAFFHLVQTSNNYHHPPPSSRIFLHPLGSPSSFTLWFSSGPSTSFWPLFLMVFLFLTTRIIYKQMAFKPITSFHPNNKHRRVALGWHWEGLRKMVLSHNLLRAAHGHFRLFPAIHYRLNLYLRAVQGKKAGSLE